MRSVRVYVDGLLVRAVASAVGDNVKSIGGRQLSGRVPKSPLFQEPEADDFQSIRNVTIGP